MLAMPVIGLVQVGEASMADRYLYLPAVGIFIVIAWGAVELTSEWPETARQMILGVGTMLAMCSCLVGTFLQVNYWHDSEMLFQHALAVAPAGNRVGEFNMGVAEYNLGQALSQKGNIKEAKPSIMKRQCDTTPTTQKRAITSDFAWPCRAILPRPQIIMPEPCS